MKYTIIENDFTQRLAMNRLNRLKLKWSLSKVSVFSGQDQLPLLPIPRAYYETKHKQGLTCHYTLEQLEDNGILIDQTNTGFLYQIFTKPVVSRPTLFLEIIERKGCNGFGSGNIKALFEAVEKGMTSH